MAERNAGLNEEMQFSLFLEGNERAFEYFFAKYNGPITSFCKQFLYDDDKANSIAQEAFISLWLNREKLEKVGGIKSFLYTAARSKCLNILKHEKVSRRYQDRTLEQREQALNLEVLNSMDFDSLTFLELEQLIEESIKELPPRTRQVFMLKRFEHKKHAEIAEELSISVKSVEAHMTKALKILKEKLSGYLPTLLVSLWF